jgi:hypothetical protein
MQWNDVEYELQMKVLDLFGDLLLKETDERLQFAMASAIVELEMWSNTPIEIEDQDIIEEYISPAVDQSNNNW